jgi:capsid protein
MPSGSAWAEDEADATGVGSFYDLQDLALRCNLQDGDAIGHAVVGGDGLMSCELIDADRIESPGSFDTDTIRAGVELGPHGERVAFHVLPSHPDDVFVGSKPTFQPVRIAANDGGFSIVQHVFKRTRPGQTRGVPLLTPSLLLQPASCTTTSTAR